MRCLMCKGSLMDKATNFIADLDGCIIVIRGVPSQVCRQCGEVSYSNEVAATLEKMVNQVKGLAGEIAVFEYSKIKIVA